MFVFFYDNGFVSCNGSPFECLRVRKIVFVLCPLNSGKGGRFSGGFDISVMQKVHQTGKLCWYNCARCKI